MLSAFTARPIIELKQQTKAKIETILANGTLMFKFYVLWLIQSTSPQLLLLSCT
jgi:hypothetical protein